VVKSKRLSGDWPIASIYSYNVSQAFLPKRAVSSTLNQPDNGPMKGRTSPRIASKGISALNFNDVT